MCAAIQQSNIRSSIKSKAGELYKWAARALLYIGKKPKTIISDNLKSGVKKADKYEAELTELAQKLLNTTNFR